MTKRTTLATNLVGRFVRPTAGNRRAAQKAGCTIQEWLRHGWPVADDAVVEITAAWLVGDDVWVLLVAEETGTTWDAPVKNYEVSRDRICAWRAVNPDESEPE